MKADESSQDLDLEGLTLNIRQHKSGYVVRFEEAPEPHDYFDLKRDEDWFVSKGKANRLCDLIDELKRKLFAELIGEVMKKK